MKKCLKCASLRKREDKDKTRYFCNLTGMMVTEGKLREHCDRFREKKEVGK